MENRNPVIKYHSYKDEDGKKTTKKIQLTVQMVIKRSFTNPDS